MQKRLGIGFVKGTVLALAIGMGVILGLRWPTPSGSLLAYLFAMAVGGTVGVFGGRAPWKEGAWLEASLKMVFGVAAGAGLYAIASRYAAFEIPFVGGSAQWTSIPPLYLTPIGAIYGAIVELDHDGTEAKKKKPAGASGVSTTMEIEDAELVPSSPPPRRK